MNQFPSGLFHPKNQFRDVRDEPSVQSLRLAPVPTQDELDDGAAEWRHGLSRRGHQSPIATPASALASTPFYGSHFASLREEDERVCLLKKKSAFDERKKVEEDNEDEEAHASDAENLNELSDLFSTIENEFGDNTSAIDFSVLLEGEHAFNVEEVSEIFSDLEEAVPVVTAQDIDDAAVVDDMAALFSSLEEMQDTDSESTTVVEEVDAQDAENVDELSELFSVLEEKEDRQQASQDWIASLDVDDVSGLYSELERLEQTTSGQDPAKAVDPRIFVPTFSIRMEGATAARPLPRVPTAFAFLAGPPVRSSGAVGGRIGLDDKRKAIADPSISETRRVCAAKRRRVNGRFVREQNSFVSITALQPSP